MSTWDTAVLATSPYYFLTLSEASGGVADDLSANNRDGIIDTSGVTYAQASIIPGDPAPRTSLLIASGTGGVRRTNTINAVGSTHAFTWKPTGPDTTARMLETSSSFRVNINATTVTVNLGATVVTIGSYDPSVLFDGVRHWIVFRANGTHVSMWVDGTKVGEGSHSETTVTITTTRMKSQTGGPIGYYQSYIIWDSAISDGTIATLWAAHEGSSPTIIAGGVATEADSALTGTRTVGARVLGGLATETDSSFAGTVIMATVVLGGLATEADSALTGTVLVGYAITGGLATETDSSFAGSLIAPIAILGGQALETDTALAGTIELGYELTDTTNGVGGLELDGFGNATWEPPVVDPTEGFIGPVEYGVEKAQAYSTPTVVAGRVIPFNPTETAVPRHFDRILAGNRDITYFRGVHTPTPSYRLVEPFLWGAGELVMPQVNALFEQVGAGELAFLAPGSPIKVQRVDRETLEVVAEDYVGFTTGRPVRGTATRFPLSGELTGRMALKDRQAPIFKGIGESGRRVFSWVRSNTLRGFWPPLGEVTGIKVPSFGGMNGLEYGNQLLAKMVKKNGDQWTVYLRDDGRWGMKLKDRTTVDFTMYFDDARIVPDLDNDISEDPTRIYASAMAPDGSRISGNVYPGIKDGPPAPYPMDDNSAFGIGTTDGATDSGDGVTVMIHRLITMNFMTWAEGIDYVYDDETAEAIERLQAEAGLTVTGTMNLATWRKLYDLDATHYTLAGATTLPMAQTSSSRMWNRTASGAIASRNPDFDRHAIIVDRTIGDMGIRATVQQVHQWSRGKLRGGGQKNWAGTVTCHYALIRGLHTPGDPIDPADVMSPRDVRPGMNGWEPHFDGGTLFHVSGAEVPTGGRSPVLTVDTRARDTMEVWQVIKRNRESRNSDTRVWLNQRNTSGIGKDVLTPWDKVAGIIDDRVRLTAGWNHFPVVAGQAGQVSRLHIELTEPLEFCVAIFGREISDARMTHLIPLPLSEAGTARWNKRWVRNALDKRVFLESWGEHEQPAGYWPGQKTDNNGATDDPITGELRDDANFSYHTFAQPVLWVSIWVPEACSVKPGRIMKAQMEVGT